MSDLWRLAVLDTADGPEVVIERAGLLASVSAVLGEEGRELGVLTDLMPLLIDWPRWSAILEDRIAYGDNAFSNAYRAADVKFRSPLTAPGKIVCIGANYHDHVAEMPIPMIPKYPYSFLKPANNTLRGSGDSVAVPSTVNKMDYEAELAAVIGVTCKDVTAANALSVIAGYANFNDLSARDWLETRPPIGVDWVRHKAFDGFAPFGPYLLPAKFVDDPQDLPLKLTVNGETKQDSSTAQMIYGVAAIIEHLTSIMTLHPGDIIATGTAAGVGHGRKPPVYLKSRDEVRMEIGDLGELVTPIV